MREADLQCGVHPPYHRESEIQLLARHEQAHANHNNCSGKHTGMLAFARMINAPLENYLAQDHPVQQAILRTFAQMCELDESEIELGVDGCTAPVFAVPLPVAAGALARFCQPEAYPVERASACRKITQAMQAHSFLVAGPGRFDTDVMAATRDKLISKVGAEGYLGLGFMPGLVRNNPNSLGLAIKISDGDLSRRAFSVAALAVLSALGVLNDKEKEHLAAHGQRPIKNWRGVQIGEIRPSRALLDALDSLAL